MASPSQGTGSAQGTNAPARIGKYQIDAEIGAGTLVRLFRASDGDTGRPVTLKLLTDSNDRRLVELFRRKVATAAKLSHKNLIAIYELGDHAGMPFAAMQFLDYGDLRQAIRNHASLTLLQKLNILCQVAEGLRAAHDGGLGSVGLRPSGIAIGKDPAAVIQDFSIVRLIGDGEEEDASYASPEELEAGVTPDALCDVYAFGAICHEFLTGVHPFHRGVEPPPPLERLVLRAMSRNRELRYQSMDEVLDDAEPILCELKRQRIATLLAEARRLQDGKDVEQAQAALRELLELDPGNLKARRMQSSIRGELQGRVVQTRYEAVFREAEEEARGRRFARAVEILEAARQVDPENPELKQRLDDMCARLERSQNAAQLAADARRLLVEQDLLQAQAKATEAQRQDPDLPESAELLHTIAEAIRASEGQGRLERQLAEANALLSKESFDAAIAMVRGLRAQSHEPALDAWLERAQAKKTEAERRIYLQSQLAASRSLLAQESLQEAVTKLTLLRDEFPKDVAVAGLLEQALEAVQRADRVRQVLAEADWLLNRDRPDLAARLLREKSQELPNQPRLAARLEAVDRLVPEWESRRLLKDALERLAVLEKLEQWTVALALAEQALQSCPGAKELHEIASRLRVRRYDEEYGRKLGRRLETIALKINTEAWPQALRLIEAAQQEFPDEAQLKLLHEHARAGLRRSECEIVSITIRQSLADGETARAQEILEKALESFNDEPLFLQLRGEIQAAEQYQESWRRAQTLFLRRQYRESEELLTAIAAPDRPEVRSLLDAIRGLRTASEQDEVFKRGREQALELIERRQFEDATELLRNLLNLFPNNPTLERDLELAQTRGHKPAVAQNRRPDGAIEQPRPAPVPPAPLPAAPQFPAAAPRLRTGAGAAPAWRSKWALVATVVLIIFAGLALWSLSHTTIKPPKALSAPAPDVPKVALQRGLHGVVKLEATVGERGTVTEVRVLTGDPILAAAAEDAVRTWRFQPAARNGRPIPMNVQVLVPFESR